MTSEAYMKQGLYLEAKIQILQREIDKLREIAEGISANSVRQRVRVSHNGVAPYEKAVQKLVDAEKKQEEMLEKLLDFRSEVSDVIETLDDPREQLVLRSFYLLHESVAEIGELLGADPKTVRRVRSRGLAHLVLPEQPIVL